MQAKRAWHTACRLTSTNKESRHGILWRDPTGNLRTKFWGKYVQASKVWSSNFERPWQHMFCTMMPVQAPCQQQMYICLQPAKPTHVLYCSSSCFECVRSSPKVALLSIQVMMRQPLPSDCSLCLSLTAMGTCSIHNSMYKPPTFTCSLLCCKSLRRGRGK